jgi:hypothetical protein
LPHRQFIGAGRIISQIPAPNHKKNRCSDQQKSGNGAIKQMMIFHLAAEQFLSAFAFCFSVHFFKKDI